MKTTHKQPGFTLIEILLVLVLLSVTAVAVIATIPTNSKDVAKKYAQSFYQRVQLLSEEAILSGLDFGIRIDEKKSTYVLMTLKSEGWQEVEFEKNTLFNRITGRARTITQLRRWRMGRR